MRLVEILKEEIAGWADRPFAEVADAIIGKMPAQMGFVPLSKQLSAHFSITTIYNGLKQLGQGR